MKYLFSALLILGVAYFAFNKRQKVISVEANAAVDVVSEDLPLQPQVSAHSVAASATETISASVSNEVVEANQDSEVSDESSVEHDEPIENVDQTVIAHEKRLAASKSAAEVFELLQKLRIRIKKLDGLSTKTTALSYAKFIGTYQGPVLNRRQESVYNLKLEIKQNDNNGTPEISGRFLIDKAKDGAVKGEFKNDFGVQLVGRDGLVIHSSDLKNYFQIYKLDNGYLAGTYYEKKSKSYKVYRFILR